MSAIDRADPTWALFARCVIPTTWRRIRLARSAERPDPLPSPTGIIRALRPPTETMAPCRDRSRSRYGSQPNRGSGQILRTGPSVRASPLLDESPRHEQHVEHHDVENV